jgi:MHS family shikimate/dehydroshikimate transporter-like MFS transporter
MQSYGPNGGWAIASYCVFAGIVSALSALWISMLARRREVLVPAQTPA